MSFRDYFWSLKDMAKNPKPINIVAGQDGLYEIRVIKGLGAFCVKVEKDPNLKPLKEGFNLELPKKISFFLLDQIIAFFRAWAMKSKLEVKAHIFWDTEKNEYFIKIPRQEVTMVEVNEKINVPKTVEEAMKMSNDMETKHVVIVNQKMVLPHNR